jgi:8-oxo-dGTP diphosphatase
MEATLEEGVDEVDGHQLINEASLVEDAVTSVLDGRDVVRAAGGVVYRLADRHEMEIALVHRPAYDDWSLPKGKLKDGERLETAALREVEEETGFRCLIALSLGAIDYTDRRGREKIVWYWLMRPIGGRFVPSPEVDRLEWHPFHMAVEQLSYTHDRVLVRRALLFHGFGPPEAS